MAEEGEALLKDDNKEKKGGKGGPKGFADFTAELDESILCFPNSVKRRFLIDKNVLRICDLGADDGKTELRKMDLKKAEAKLSEEADTDVLLYSGTSDDDDTPLTIIFGDKKEAKNFITWFKKDSNRSGLANVKKLEDTVDVDAISNTEYAEVEGIVYCAILHVNDASGDDRINPKDHTEFAFLAESYDDLGDSSGKDMEKYKLHKRIMGASKSLPALVKKHPDVAAKKPYFWYPVPMKLKSAESNPYTAWLIHKPKDKLVIFGIRGERFAKDRDNAKLFVDGVLRQFLKVYPAVEHRVTKSGGVLTQAFNADLRKMVDYFNNKILRKELKLVDEVAINMVETKKTTQKAAKAQASKREQLERAEEEVDKMRDTSKEYLDVSKLACMKWTGKAAAIWAGIIGTTVLGIVVVIVVATS